MDFYFSKTSKIKTRIIKSLIEEEIPSGTNRHQIFCLGPKINNSGRFLIYIYIKEPQNSPIHNLMYDSLYK